MTNQINIAVVGVGRWGVHLLRNFLEHPQARVVAVVDPNSERLAAIKRQYFSSTNTGENVLFTTKWQAIKQIAKLDAVVFATPASTHYSLIRDALHWGYHVLAEKPLTLDPRECLELCQLAEKQQRQLMVDHTYLFHPAVELGQNVVQEGKLGDLRYGYACRTHLGPVRQDVDALWDLAIHDIAIFNTWLGQQPVSVQASGRVWLQGGQGEPLRCGGSLRCSTWRGQGGTRGPLWGLGGEGGQEDTGTRGISNPRSPIPDPQSPIPDPRSPIPNLSDLVWVTLTYPDGFQAYIHLCWLNPDKQRRLVVVGSRGSLIFDEMSAESPLKLLYGELEVQGSQFIPVNQSQQALQIETNEPLRKVCDRFLTCVHNNTACVVSSGLVGTQLVTILAALTESLNQGGKLVFLDKNQY